jgi:hypothetical protein
MEDWRVPSPHVRITAFYLSHEHVKHEEIIGDEVDGRNREAEKKRKRKRREKNNHLLHIPGCVLAWHFTLALRQASQAYMMRGRGGGGKDDGPLSPGPVGGRGGGGSTLEPLA